LIYEEHQCVHREVAFASSPALVKAANTHEYAAGFVWLGGAGIPQPALTWDNTSRWSRLLLVLRPGTFTGLAAAGPEPVG
jgi:hypothetical protein